jgi:HEAT repeat protein
LVTLERSLTRGSLKSIKKKQSILNHEAVASICESLGKIGTEKSRDILQKLKKQNESNWKIKAEEALARIAERGESQKNPLQAP